MSTKEQTLETNNNHQMKKATSQKSKKTVFNEISNKNLNTSIDSVKNEKQTLKINQKNDQKPDQSEHSELIKQKVQAIKTLKQVENQQRKIKAMIQKSIKKLPEIRQSSHSKQNHPYNSIKKSLPLSLHRPDKQNQSTLLQRIKKIHVTDINYSIVNGKKVYMSEEDVVKLKKLKLQYRKREQQIRKKVVAHDQMIEKMKTEEVMSKEKQIQTEKQRRMKSIQEKEKILEKERKQKLQRFKEENKKLKELKKSKKLFQKMEQQFHTIEQQQKSNVDELIKSRMGSGKVSFDQIKEHERQYLDKKEETIQNSRVKIQSKIKDLQDEFNHLNLHKSIFYERVKNEKKQMHEQIQENQRKRKVYSQKIQQYKQIVKENHMPKIIKIQQVEEKKLPTYNITEIQNIGNEYMKQGKKLIDRNKSLVILEKMRKEEAQKRDKQVYRNYLHQNRTQASPMKKSKSYSKMVETQVDKQMKLINTIKNPKEKYEQIKLLQNKIQKDLKSTLPIGGKIKLKSGSKHTNAESQIQVNQIAAKLKLLQGLQNIPQL